MIPDILLYVKFASIVAIVVIIVHFLTKKFGCNCSSNRKEFAIINKDILPEEQKKLLSKLEFLEKKIVRLADKLNSLQTTANISKEQLDFATSNLNGITAVNI
jgi:predicted ferric reductase